MADERKQGSGEDWYRYALALEASQEGFWDWDLTADRLWGSERWQEITGMENCLEGMSRWLERVHPHDRPRLEAEMRAIRTGRVKQLRSEHRIRRGPGEWRWVEARGVAAKDPEGRVMHLAGSLLDNTERRMADALTGLPNRLWFLDRLERRLDRARLRNDWGFAVLALSLERFGRVNEMLGVSGGDRLLLETARRLEESLSEESFAARLSGPEFLVCLEGVRGEAEAMSEATRLAEACRQPFAWRGHRVTPQLAMGVVQAEETDGHPEELMGEAESALARAREHEPPGVVCYTRGMREEAMERLELEADLERAIRSGELVMHYQPEVDLETGRIVGFEALVRWRHAKRGLLPPGEFIPLAEETGLILPLGDWGLAEACQQLTKWRAGGCEELRNVRMSVNLSGRQFEQPDLVRRVGRVLEATGLGPGSLRLEVTESSVISDAPAAQKTMRELGRLGVGLHMDDFGVGYSSLHYLKRFPFDTLKIDRSFVRGMVRDRESHQIVRSILDLARTFGMDVVAEGIEDEEQVEALKRLGCPCGQGYYFARPMEPAAIDALMAAGAWQGQPLAAAEA